MTDETSQEGLKERITRQGEDTIGRLAQDLLENPLLNGAITRALDAQKKAAQAQEVAMGALNLPSASDIERLTRRVRSVSQRLEGIEDSVDGVDDRLGEIKAGVERLEGRLEEISVRVPEGEAGGELADRLDEIARDLAALRASVAPGREPPPRAQERLSVTES